MAFLASSFVTCVIGNYPNLRGNGPNYNFSILLIFSIEVAASSLLVGVRLLDVYAKGHERKKYPKLLMK